MPLLHARRGRVGPDARRRAPERGEIERAGSRAGATKVRLTGGEPTLRRDLTQICGAIAALPGVESVGVTTNGINLLRKEGAGALLDNLVDAGLTSVNLSLDSLDATKFAALTRRPGKTLDRVNCVVMRGENDDELAAFARRWAGTGVEVRFIEWMPFQANDWSAGKLVAYDDMLGALGSLAPGERLYQRDSDAADPHDTTRWWRLGGAKLGFITSMTDHFCGGCNRVRVTADGSLKTCLFGSDSVSLRDVLRGGASDADLAAAVHAALQKNHFRHGGHGGAEDLAKHAGENRHMVRIGG
ncbi:cyclic pyranopterin monophosphate synthase [Aureococcus anophagefferens]|nr:cyclic pyranopterin monophosphate synthase [Aureococcus anophagefferens]